MSGEPSTLADLLADCDAHGIRLALADGGGLEIDAPQDVLTPDLLARLKAHKAELLAMLRPDATAPPEAPESTADAPHGLGIDLAGRPSESILERFPLAAKPCESPTPVCRCGATTWRDVVLGHAPHHGTTIRRDCGRCGRFLDFPVWYGKDALQNEMQPIRYQHGPQETKTAPNEAGERPIAAGD